MKLFSKKPTVREQVKSSQRIIGANVRDLERELATLKRQEQQVVRDIKAAASKNNEVGAKVLAKQLVRLRAQQTKLLTAIASLRGVSTSVVVSAELGLIGLFCTWCAVQYSYVGKMSTLDSPIFNSHREKVVEVVDYVLCRLQRRHHLLQLPWEMPQRPCKQWDKRPTCPKCKRICKTLLWVSEVGQRCFALLVPCAVQVTSVSCNAWFKCVLQCLVQRIVEWRWLRR